MVKICLPQPHLDRICASSHCTSASSACYILLSLTPPTSCINRASFATNLAPRLTPLASAKSNATIPHALDAAMDKANPTTEDVQPGISMAFGPVDDNMEVDQPATNGAATNGKRKASMTNGKTYKDASDSESDDVPLVRDRLNPTIYMRPQHADSSIAKASQDFSFCRLRRR